MVSSYALSWIQRAPNNQSPWYYLSGIFKGGKFADQPYVKEKALECRERYPTCAHVLSLLVDIWEEEATPESLELAVQVLPPPSRVAPMSGASFGRLTARFAVRVGRGARSWCRTWRRPTRSIGSTARTSSPPAASRASTSPHPAWSIGADKTC